MCNKNRNYLTQKIFKDLSTWNFINMHLIFKYRNVYISIYIYLSSIMIGTIAF